MTLSDRNKLSIAELVCYTPALFCSVFLCIRHGFALYKGWIYLLLFSLVRISGASVELATIAAPTDIPLLTTAVLLSSIGLSPLLLTTLGLLHRVCKSINKEQPTIINARLIRLLRIPIVIGLVLVIIGSDNSASYVQKHGTYPIQIETKIGIIIIVAVFAAIVTITALFMSQRSNAEPGERRLIYAIVASIPSILVRLLYVLLIFFSNIQIFSILHGSVVALGCMAIMQELIVVIIYIGVGLTLPRRVKEPELRGGEVGEDGK